MYHPAIVFSFQVDSLIISTHVLSRLSGDGFSKCVFFYFIYVPFILMWLGNSLSMYQLFSVADGHTIRDWGSPPLPRPRLSTLGTEEKASNSPPPRPPRPSRRSQCCNRLDAIKASYNQLYVTHIYPRALVFCCMFAL